MELEKNQKALTNIFIVWYILYSKYEVVEQWLTIFQLVNYCVFNPVWSQLNKHALKWSLSGESPSLAIGLGERLALDKQSLKWNLSNEPTSPKWSRLQKALKWIISQKDRFRTANSQVNSLYHSSYPFKSEKYVMNMYLFFSASSVIPALSSS